MRVPRIPQSIRYYSLFTLFMLVTFECTVVMQRLKNLHDIRALQAPKQVGWMGARVWWQHGRQGWASEFHSHAALCVWPRIPRLQSIMAYRCGKWEKIPGDDVLPGDLVSIVREGARKESGCSGPLRACIARVACSLCDAEIYRQSSRLSISQTPAFTFIHEILVVLVLSQRVRTM